MNIEAIRAALVSVVVKRSRPHYEMLTVKEVINAFRLNQHHSLKQIVAEEIARLGLSIKDEVNDEEGAVGLEQTASILNQCVLPKCKKATRIRKFCKGDPVVFDQSLECVVDKASKIEVKNGHRVMR